MNMLPVFLQTIYSGKKASVIFLSLLCFGMFSCNQKKQPIPVSNQPQTAQPQAPEFNADSAYAFIKEQVDFGPRVPNTKAHEKCAEYLAAKMKQYNAEVIVQTAKVTAYNGTVLNIKNIIARINPAAKQRMLLFAHWDTRPWADRDTTRTNEPPLGADDGASGVGVLIEVARALTTKQHNYGIDIIFFDAEDYGVRHGEERADTEDSYALGAQYWCNNLIPSGYKADYGILLDMVGARDARFGLEENSKRYALSLLTTVWNVANRLGYGNYFIYLDGGFVTDDHLYVSRMTGIPCIDIIHTSTSTGTGFPAHWHTHGDNMDVIDKNTLKAVGQTLLEFIYMRPVS